MTARIGTASTESLNPQSAARELAAHPLAANAVGAIVYCTVDLDVEAFRACLVAAMPGVPFMGSTVCGQVAKDGGAGFTAAAMFFAGDGFTFGVAHMEGEGGRQAGEALAEAAARAAGSSADQTRFAVLHATPGLEEELLAGLARGLPSSTEVVGGSAADNTIEGRWAVFSHEAFCASGAVLLVSDWPWRCTSQYQSGYLPTRHSGTITRARGRRIFEIDGRPAVQVYSEWSGLQLPREESILATTTLSPLGVVRGGVGGLDLHLVVHPEVAHEDGSIATFAAVREGETAVLMTSSLASLSRRGATIAKYTRNRALIGEQELVGAIFVYCAGCSLALGDTVATMVERTAQELGAPFLMPFTFGEQGSVCGGDAEHGNLMCSVLLLGGAEQA